MITVIGVRFRHGGKVYDFDPGTNVVEKGDYVVVETARGVEYGMVVQDARVAADDMVVLPVRTILRKATEADKKHAEGLIEQEKKALEICKQKVEAHNLEMKLVDAEYTFDNAKLLFYFTADGRVDFRDLVKDLASVFKTRIELRQIGVRDDAKACPSIGICGRPFCCVSFLPDFIPVSIKMAKDQNLSLNPTKISGTCGRLMCCLKYEEQVYEHLSHKMPSQGDLVHTPDGDGEVLSVNLLREQMKVGVRETEKDDVEIKEYDLADITVLQHKRKRSQEPTAEEKRQLAELEKNNG